MYSIALPWFFPEHLLVEVEVCVHILRVFANMIGQTPTLLTDILKPKSRK